MWIKGNSMKALQKFADGKDGMGIREVPEPVIGAEDLLVEVGAVGVCGSDLHIWRDEKEHRRPVTLGHEFSGVIVPRISLIRPTLSAALISAPGPPMSVCTHPGWRMATFTPPGARSMEALFITALSAAFDER